MKERATFVEDMLTEGVYLLERPTGYDEVTVSKKWKEGTSDLLIEFKNKLQSLETFNSAAIENCFKSFLEEKQLGVGAVLPLFRLVLTGTGMGPSMFDITAFLGKEESITRIESGILAIESLVAKP
jgi:glutamyl-tRNA synthetase